MQGSVRRSKNGRRWRAAYKVQDIRSGKWRQVTRTFDGRREAEAWLRRTTAGYGEKLADARDLTLAEYLDEWFEFASPEWSPNTRKEARYLISRVTSALGLTPITKLTTRDIDRWIAKMRTDGLHPGTIAKRFYVLRSAFRQAVRWQYLLVDPTQNATLPRQTRKKLVPPTQDQIITLLEACREHSHDFGVLAHLAASTGARRGELLALRWSDIDLEKASLTISRAVAHGDGNDVIVKATKTGNTRSVALGPLTLDLLRKHRKVALERALRLGIRTTDGFLFSHEADGSLPWRPDFVTMTWGRIRCSVGLDSVRFHDLRHFVATSLLTSGVDLSTVAGRLGHADGGRTTLVVYSHFLQQADKGAAEVIDALLVAN